MNKGYRLKKKKFFHFLFLRIKETFLVSFCLIFIYLSLPEKLSAIDSLIGEDLFKSHCAGCHINGGNIIRRSKNLKLSSLKRNGIDNTEAIAKIARQGLGIMSGYEDQLGDNGDNIVANWVLEQAQRAWVQE
tara:strand:- start:391 stop:786 length:396 start_codon:yes stop_codon:yes gene_type:complete